MRFFFEFFFEPGYSILWHQLLRRTLVQFELYAAIKS